jgi:uncharacterized protein YbaR (Trm112 family)
MLAEHLLQILACPIDKGPLLYFPDRDLLLNPRLKRTYRVKNGVPVLLAHAGRPLTEDACRQLLDTAAECGVLATAGARPGEVFAPGTDQDQA